MELTDRYVRIHTQIEKTTQFVIHLVKKGNDQKEEGKENLIFQDWMIHFFLPTQWPMAFLSGTSMAPTTSAVWCATSRGQGRGPRDAGKEVPQGIREHCG